MSCRPEPTDNPTVYISPGNFYNTGALAVQNINVPCWRAPAELAVYTPEQPAAYPIVIFLHGFTGSNQHYETMLRHLASHGFIVVAPQMYTPDCYACAPAPALEGLKGLAIVSWVRRNIGKIVSVTADTRRIGIVGHSRGGQIAFRVALAHGNFLSALAAVDPVDGLEMFGQDIITDKPLDISLPFFIIGTGLGPELPENATFPLACAPADIGHDVFYAQSSPPAWHAVAVRNGHNDMIDEEDFSGDACPGGPDRDGMRAFTAGTLAAFFSATLQNNQAAFGALMDTALAPVPVMMEIK